MLFHLFSSLLFPILVALRAEKASAVTWRNRYAGTHERPEQVIDKGFIDDGYDDGRRPPLKTESASFRHRDDLRHSIFGFFPYLFYRKIQIDVVVGGAGMAGIGAARVLHLYGVGFRMVEASDRIGGRVHSGSVGGNTVELGAQFFSGYGASDCFGDLRVVSIECLSPVSCLFLCLYLPGGKKFDNPVFTVAEDQNMNSVRPQYDPVSFHTENGTRMTEEADYETGTFMLDMFYASEGAEMIAEDCLQANEGDTLNRDMQSFCNDAFATTFVPANDDDESLEQCHFLANGWTADAKSPIARTAEVYFVDYSFGAGPEVVSCADHVPDVTDLFFSSRSPYVLDPRGYEWVPKTIAAEFLSTATNTDTVKEFNDERLLLNTKIVKVDYGDRLINRIFRRNKIKIVVCETTRVEEPNQPIKYPCKDGRNSLFHSPFRVIRANRFISTFSVEVLKKSLELERSGVSEEDSIDIAPRFNPPLSSDAALEALDRNELGHSTRLYMQFTEKFLE